MTPPPAAPNQCPAAAVFSASLVGLATWAAVLTRCCASTAVHPPGDQARRLAFADEQHWERSWSEGQRSCYTLPAVLRVVRKRALRRGLSIDGGLAPSRKSPRSQKAAISFTAEVHAAVFHVVSRRTVACFPCAPGRCAKFWKLQEELLSSRALIMPRFRAEIHALSSQRVPGGSENRGHHPHHFL
jgi:hypothetical protein